MFLCSTKCDQRLVLGLEHLELFKTEKSEYKHIEENKACSDAKKLLSGSCLSGVTALASEYIYWGI